MLPRLAVVLGALASCSLAAVAAGPSVSKVNVYMGGENARWTPLTLAGRGEALEVSTLDADVGYAREIDAAFKTPGNPYGKALRIEWTSGRDAVFALVSAGDQAREKSRVDAEHRRYRENGVLVFNMKVLSSEETRLSVGVSCKIARGGEALQKCRLPVRLAADELAAPGLWQTYRIPLREFPGLLPAVGGLGRQSPAFAISSEGPAEIVLANIRWEIYPEGKDPAESLADDLLAEMSLEEKIGQMAQVLHNDGNPANLVTAADAAGKRVGSLFADSVQPPHDEQGRIVEDNAANWAALVNRYQRSVAASTDKAIPILMGIDAVHGLALVPGATIFPHNIGLGASGNEALLEEIGRVTAREATAAGFRMTFSPTLAVARDERWGRTYESLSELPGEVGRLGVAMQRGYQGDTSRDDLSDLARAETIAATAKHYGGDGASEFVDPGGFCKAWDGCGAGYSVDRLDTDLDLLDLIDLHLQPYVEAIESGVSVIMMSDSFWHGEHVTGSRELITDVLKGDFGYEGIVLTDFQAWRNVVPGDAAASMRAAVNAGNDLFMLPFQGQVELLQQVVADGLASGAISQERIDDAARRILRVKFELGLFDISMAQDGLLDTVGSEAHRDVARQAVRESLVLLKNDPEEGGSAPVLPLDRGLNVYVAGKSAHDIGIQSGGWTGIWQGVLGNDLLGDSILEGIEDVSLGAVVHSPEATADMSGSDVGIVVVGEYPYSEFCGDVLGATFFCEFVRPSPPAIERGVPEIPHPVGLPAPQTMTLASSSFDYFTPIVGFRALPTTIDPVSDLEVIDRVCSEMPCVVVLVSGRPLFIEPALEMADAFVAAWLPGGEGGGVADVLFARDGAGFTGKLTHTWPATPRDPLDPSAFSAEPELDYVPQNELVGGLGNLDSVLFPHGYGLSYED